jgi:hypothetical protein
MTHATNTNQRRWMRIKRRDGSIKDIESHGRPFDLRSIADDILWIRLFHGAVEIATIYACSMRLKLLKGEETP